MNSQKYKKKIEKKNCKACKQLLQKKELQDSFVPRHLLPSRRGHFLGIWLNPYPTQIQPVGIETGIDGGVARAAGRGMLTAGLLKQGELLVAEVFQQAVPQAFHHQGRTGAMLQVVAVVFPAAVVQIGEQPYDGHVTLGSGQQQPVALHTLPMRDAMQRP